MAFGGFLSEGDIEKIIARVQVRKLAALENALDEGEIAHEVYFVDKGILRVFSLAQSGEEVTKYFVRPNQFIVELESFYNFSPSDATFQAVVDTQLLIITRPVWRELLEEIPKFFILTKSLTEITLLNKLKDNDFLNFGTARDKYREFLRRYPDLARDVPLQQIASYLKITPQSLSRIRKQISEEG